jgi:hypothetical protein
MKTIIVILSNHEEKLLKMHKQLSYITNIVRSQHVKEMIDNLTFHIETVTQAQDKKLENLTLMLDGLEKTTFAVLRYQMWE